MPTPENILRQLAAIAATWRVLAIAWHGYFALLVLALLMRLPLPQRALGILLSLPLFSVSALAWSVGNAFTGACFALVGLVLLVLALRLSREKASVAPPWALAAGAALFVYGWTYPHFVSAPAPLHYAVAAPAGLLPCPTLAIVSGPALAARGLGARAWPLVLAAAALFYGLFGALRLGVALDWGLAAGAVILACSVFFGARRSEAT